jgi:hypothetical protein
LAWSVARGLLLGAKDLIVAARVCLGRQLRSRAAHLKPIFNSSIYQVIDPP